MISINIGPTRGFVISNSFQTRLANYNSASAPFRLNTGGDPSPAVEVIGLKAVQSSSGIDPYKLFISSGGYAVGVTFSGNLVKLQSTGFAGVVPLGLVDPNDYSGSHPLTRMYNFICTSSQIFHVEDLGGYKFRVFTVGDSPDSYDDRILEIEELVFKNGVPDSYDSFVRVVTYTPPVVINTLTRTFNDLIASLTGAEVISFVLLVRRRIG